MLLVHGKLKGSDPWRILEVAIGQSPDVMALRISKQLKRIGKSGEVLVPFRRNQNGDPEWIIEHVYVRGFNGSLGLLARTPGIDYVRDEKAPEHWIHELLERERVAQKSEPRLNDFVRVLTGPCARLCGEIEKLKCDSATVRIDLPTKRVRVYTKLSNLQRIDCKPEDRTFFFQTDLF